MIEADVYALSYPKAGRTWLRALIGKVLVDQMGLSERRILETEFLTRRAGVPMIGFDHDGSAMRFNVRWQDMPRARHRYAGRRVLLMGRDVRDNMVSAYFQATRRIKVWNQPIAPFLRDDYYGVDKLLTFYGIWAEHRAVPAAFMFIRYEELHTDTAGTLARVLPFFGIAAGADAIAAAVDYCRFENLQRGEAEQRFRGRALVAGVAGDPEAFKVRRGKVGGYVDYLSADEIAYIDEAVAERGCDFTRPAAIPEAIPLTQPIAT
jgi:hypothetical protein